MEKKYVFTNICRICLSADMANLYSLFDTTLTENGCLAKILTNSCGIQVDKNDMLPNTICIRCGKQLLSLHKFKRRCEKSDTILRAYIKKNNTRNSHFKGSKADSNKLKKFVEDAEYSVFRKSESITIVDDSEDALSISSDTDLKQECSDEDEKKQKKSSNKTRSNTNKLLEKGVSNASNNIKEGLLKNENDNEDVLSINLDTALKEEYVDTDKPEPVKKGEELPFQCKLCTGEFSKRLEYIEHLKIHDESEPFICKECGKCFTRYRQLVQHLKSHNGEKPHLCTTCGRRFALSSNLKVHMRIHTGVKPYSCRECGKCFTQWSTLRSHIVSHTGERAYVCSMCGKTFTRSGTLSKHMNSHTGDKQYPCTLCNKSFKSSTQRSRHLVTHTGEKKYVCTVCNKAFNRSSNLRVHTKIHTGDRPHGCPICGKRFIQLHCLNSHLNTHKYNV